MSMMFKMKSIQRGLAGLFSCLALSGNAEPEMQTVKTEANILPESKMFYVLETDESGDENSGLFQVQAYIFVDKVAGFRSKALSVEVNGEILKPDRLLERGPSEIKIGGSTYTYCSSAGELIVPFGPFAEAIDGHPVYALASRHPIALYTFNLEGMVHSGKNIIKLRNTTADRTIVA